MPSTEVHTIILRPAAGALYGASTVMSGWVAVPPGTRVVTVQNRVFAAPGGTTPVMATYVLESLDLSNTRTVEQWSNINSQSTTQVAYPVAIPNQYGSGFPAKYVSLPYIQIQLTFGGTTPTFDAEVTISFI